MCRRCVFDIHGSCMFHSLVHSTDNLSKYPVTSLFLYASDKEEHTGDNCEAFLQRSRICGPVHQPQWESYLCHNPFQRKHRRTVDKKTKPVTGLMLFVHTSALVRPTMWLFQMHCSHHPQSSWHLI